MGVLEPTAEEQQLARYVPSQGQKNPLSVCQGHAASFFSTGEISMEWARTGKSAWEDFGTWNLNVSGKAQAGEKIQSSQDLAYIILGQTWCHCVEAKLTETAEMCLMVVSFIALAEFPAVYSSLETRDVRPCPFACQCKTSCKSETKSPWKPISNCPLSVLIVQIQKSLLPTL